LTLLPKRRLDKHPDAKLEVYAVWFNMIRTDSRWLRQKRWLDDSRVVHFWDEEKLAGRFWAENVTQAGDIEWDAFFLYGPDASWGERPARTTGLGPAHSQRKTAAGRGAIPSLRATGVAGRPARKQIGVRRLLVGAPRGIEGDVGGKEERLSATNRCACRSSSSTCLPEYRPERST